MKQQVNLYTRELRPQRELWSLNQLAMVAVAAVAIIALASGTLRWTLSGSEAELAAKKNDLAAMRLVVEELNLSLADRREEAGLKDRVEGLQRQVRMRRDLVTRADQLAQATRHGFSPYLTGLARQSDDRLWLTRIRLDLMAGTVELQGQTNSGDQVPRYLTRLKQEPLFDGRRFSHFVLDRDDDAGILEFRLASQRPAETRRGP